MTPEVQKKPQPNSNAYRAETQEDHVSGLRFDSDQSTNLRQTTTDGASGLKAGATWFRSPEPRMNLADCTPPSHQ